MDTELVRGGADVMSIGAAIGLSGPYPAYCGYENLAVTRGWWAGFWLNLHGHWVDMTSVAFVAVLLGWLFWQLWEDYRVAAPTGTPLGAA